MEFQYKINNSLDNRKSQYRKVIENHPDSVPVILERAKGCTINKTIKTKYILSKELTMAELVKIIREKLELSPERAIFLLVNGKTSLTGDSNLIDIYEKYADKEDGFLYIAYASELTWGNN